MRIRKVIAVGALAGLALTACGSDGGSSDAPANRPDTVDLAVASQFTPVAEKLAAAYRSENPGKKVAVSSLDVSAMGAVIAGKTVDIAVVPSGWLGTTEASGRLGRNLAVIAVPTANPGNVAGVSAFDGKSRLRTTVCGVDTPVGDFSLGVLRRAGVTPRTSTIDTSTDCPEKAMTALAGGQLDAALMFRNNVTVPAGVKTIAVPDNDNFIVPIDYVVLQDNADSSGFRTFLDSSQARTVLTENGYLP
jgi:ABC-type molybdate transport system substrate-binding protein